MPLPACGCNGLAVASVIRYAVGMKMWLALLLTVVASAASAQPLSPGLVRVKIVTSKGDIVVALDARRAPKTTANFLAYVDDGRLDGTSFYRAVRRKENRQLGFVQGGIGADLRRSLSPIKLEPTNVTGIRHVDATISMAHGDNPDTANGNFSIQVGAAPSLDAGRGKPGYAAFGHVVSGMDVVRKMLALPTGGGGIMKGELILSPVTIVSVRRLDGVARPTGKAKPWLITLPR